MEYQGAEDENAEGNDLDEQARFNDFQSSLRGVGVRRCDLAATCIIFVITGSRRAGMRSYQWLVQGEK